MASRGINKAIIVGNLGNDPEMRYLPNGTAVTNISVATSENWKDKQTGEAKEKTEWHRIEAFGRLAEIMGQYLRKGSQVYIEGAIRTDKWQDQNGQDRYSTKIRADNMQMLGSAPGQGTSSFNPDTTRMQAAPTQTSTVQTTAQTTSAAEKKFEVPKMNDDDDFSDDIPF